MPKCQKADAQSRKEVQKTPLSTQDPQNHFFKQKCLEASLIISNAKENFFAKKLDLVKRDSKATSQLVNYLIGTNKEKVLPSGKSEVDTANVIAQFF